VFARGRSSTWRILQSRKRSIALAAVLGTVVAFLFTKLESPVYKAVAILEIQDVNDSFMNIKQVMPFNDGELSNILSDVQTQIQVLESRTLLNGVVSGMSPTGSRLRRTLEQLRRDLRVRALGQTKLVELSVDANDPHLAADFLDRICQEFIKQNIETRLKVSRDTGEWLGRLLQGMQAKLRQSESAVQSYARRSGLMLTSEKKNIEEETLRQLQEELSRAQANLVAKQSRYERAQSSAADAISDVLADSSLREYEVKLTDLRRQRAEAASTYTAENSKVKRLDAQIVAVENSVRREQRNIIGRIYNDYQEAKRRYDLLAAQCLKQRRLVSDLSERAIQYDILQHEVESNRQLYDGMLQRVKEATIASAMRASNIRVLDSAIPPEKPYKPKVLLNCVLGLSTFCLGAAVFIVFRERNSVTLNEPGDGKLYLNIAEMGIILHDQRAQAMMHLPQKTPGLKLLDRIGATALFNRIGATGPLNRRIEQGLCRQRRSDSPQQLSPVLDSLRSVATSVLFTGVTGSSTRLIALASASPGDGKTTIVANLGWMMSEIGYRVLLVDADLARGRLHEYFGLPNSRGLASMLRAPEKSQLSLDAYVEPITGSKVGLVTGGCSRTEEHLLHSREFPKLLEQIRTQSGYDIVLIDTPPLLQSVDARIISRLVDHVIFIARARHTTIDEAVAAVERLAGDNARVLGMILNDWNPKHSTHAYYGLYGHQYTASPGQRMLA
jgi:capsular exopolysaccharide synthesis family protein